MLKRTASLERGVTLIELMTVLAVVGLVLVLGAPSFFQWNQNSQIRSSAESMFAGIKFARAEAVKRNGIVRFQLMKDTGSSCALSTTPIADSIDTNKWIWEWVVSLSAAAGKCDVADSSQFPFIIRFKTNAETERSAYSASQSEIDFNGLGQVTPTPAEGDIVIDITNPLGGSCIVDSGKMRCLRILVAAGGQARMCDLSVPVTAVNDTRKC